MKQEKKMIKKMENRMIKIIKKDPKVHKFQPEYWLREKIKKKENNLKSKI